MLLLVALGFAEAALLRFVHNRRAKKSIERLIRLWKEDMEDADLRQRNVRYLYGKEEKKKQE